jgi:hypothetical protein
VRIRGGHQRERSPYHSVRFEDRLLIDVGAAAGRRGLFWGASAVVILVVNRLEQRIRDTCHTAADDLAAAKAA